VILFGALLTPSHGHTSHSSLRISYRCVKPYQMHRSREVLDEIDSSMRSLSVKDDFAKKT
jgi:hypothetical protein